MTQAYRCDETALENQNDSKFSLEKKRDAFLSRKKIGMRLTRVVFVCWISSVDDATKDEPHGAACVDVDRATHSAWTMFPNEKALSATRILFYGDACFDCMTWRKAP
jgi:hypothetical protein